MSARPGHAGWVKQEDRIVPQISLQTILRLDAGTCAAMGGLLTLMSGPVAGLTQINAGLLFWAGLLLFPVAAFLAASAHMRPTPDPAVQVAVAGNVLWVVASLALPASGVIAPNGLGWAFLMLQAAAVAVFAWLEWHSVRRVGASA